MKRTSDPVASSAKMDERNRRVYGDPQVVKHYRGASALQPAERVIFDRIANDLTDAALLDVGVGGGRTTLHLAPRVRRYVGLDYAPAESSKSKEGPASKRARCGSPIAFYAKWIRQGDPCRPI